MQTKKIVVNASLALLVAGSGFVAYRQARPVAKKTATLGQTETVTKGDVVSTVSASGNVESATDLSVSFQQGGRVTQVLVAGGDRVTAGQELAVLDDASQTAALASAQASLASAKAKAAKTIDGLSAVEREQNQATEAQSKSSVDSAAVALDNARQTAATNKAAYQNAVDQARRSVTTAESSLLSVLTKASADNAAAEDSVTAARTSLQNAQDNARRDNDSADVNVATSQATVDDAKKQLDANVANLRTGQGLFDVNISSSETLIGTVTRYNDITTQCRQTNTGIDGVSCSQVAYLLQLAQTAQKQEGTWKQAVTSLSTATSNRDATRVKGEQSVFTQTTSLNNTINTQRTMKSTGETNETNAQNSLATVKEKLNDALQNQTAGLLKDRQTIKTQQAQVTSADKALSSQRAGNAVKAKPATADQLAADKASVEQAENQVATATKNLNDTILKAPVGGTVAALNGAVGDDVSIGGSAKAFLTLTNPDSIKVRVGFSEADALRLSVGQLAKITLDSASDRVFTGKVTSIDQTQTIVSNVVTYYADVDLVGDTAGVRTGMSASVEVTVAERKGVLTLPSRAVKGTAKTTTLQVRTPVPVGSKGDPTDKPVQVGIGLRGDEKVEIISGLPEGTKVVLPSSGGGLGGLGGFTPPGGGLGGGLGG
jgi:membrane fusion protein, macrolide-specific efflux system